jgi:mannosyltransferase
MGICIVCGLLFVGVAVLIRQVSGVSRWASHYPWAGREFKTVYDLWPFAWMMLCWFVLPIVLSYIVSQGPLRLFSTRYLVVVVAPFCLLAVLCVVVLRRKLVQILLICALVGSSALVVPHYYQNAQVEDWNTAVHWLLARYQPDDGLVCYDNSLTQGCQIAVEYYLDAYPDGAHFSTDTPGAFSWEKFSTDEPQENSEQALEPAALANFASQHKRLFMITGRISNSVDADHVKKTQQWLDQHYQFDAQIVTQTVVILLYTTR